MHLDKDTLLCGGKYRITRFIARGGFGCTYEGIHVQLGTRVAIKEFFVGDFCNRDMASGRVSVATVSKNDLVEKLRGKFLAEARALFNMKHQGIVNVHDVFEENDTAYYVMDFIDGMTLSEHIAKFGPFNETDAVNIMLNVADAINYVHSRGMLHLDIKPGNIMLDKSGQVVLIDFGVSKQYDEAGGANTSTILGMTPGYSAPEQMGHDTSLLSPATDIYAMGATMYTLLTGSTPPGVSGLASGSVGISLPTTVSPHVADTIFRSMNLVVNQRPASADEFAHSLLSGPAIPQVTTTVNYMQPQNYQVATTQDSGGSNKVLIGVIVGLAIIAIIMLVVFLLGRGGDEPTYVEAEETVEKIVISSSPEVTYTPSTRTFNCADGGEVKMLPIPGYSSAYIASTECPQWLYKAVMNSNPSEMKSPNYPVTNVSWNDCNNFTKALSQVTGLSFSLPTGAQWDAAANDGHKYSGSNAIDEVAWYKSNSDGMIHPVAQKKPNAVGAYDMSGNVFEWVREKQGRSGSYNFDSSFAKVNYVNHGNKPSATWGDLGFRFALE